MSKHLPIVGASQEAPTPRKKHPSWLRVKFPGGEGYKDLKSRLSQSSLNTVCQSASCPNIGECWNNRALTIMILGDICTRSCRFCDVKTGKPNPVDEGEPERVAELLADLDLHHTVITSVDRDDLKDGGASIWRRTLEACHRHSPEMTIEVLVPDFKGADEEVDTVLAGNPDVFAHNLETVPRLSRQVRVQARYDRSLHVLEYARKQGALTKTGMMLGLGETKEELIEVIDTLGSLGLSILTLGQYLQPSKKHLDVERYVHPDEFAELKERALLKGVHHIESGPLVRSSYHADGQAELICNMQQQSEYGKIGFASLKPQ